MEEETKDLTRRSLLQRSGWLMAAAALPVLPQAALASLPQAGEPNSKGGAPDSPAVMARLSTYMSEAGEHPLPEAVSEKAKQHILDTFAAMISGADLPPAKVAFKFAHAYGGERVATVVGSNLLCGPIEAAMANGMLAQSDETDDSHSPSHSHPGCAIVPAALATGEKFGISGARFLRAVTLGYDIGTRVTMSMGGLQYQMDSHRSTHSIANTFGASAAAGCAAGLSAEQMRWTLDYSAQQASGFAAWQRDTQHIEKASVFGGFPARNGVSTALLIHLGATGVDDIFSGANNFFTAFAPNADRGKLTDGLGERYEITRTNIKKWTVGSPIQAPLDALDLIMKQHPFNADQVQKVVVRIATSEAKTVDNRTMPDISLQHLIAVMLIDKTVSFAAAHDKARMQDPKVLAVRAKVQLVHDEQLELLYPQLVAVVEVTLKDGKQFTQRVDAVRGTVRNPMTREELQTKASDLMTPFLGPAASAKLIQAVFDLEKMPDLRALSPLLQGSR